MKKNKIKLVDRHIYLEKWLKESPIEYMTNEELINHFIQNFKNKKDVEYLINAYILPKDDIIRELSEKKEIDINETIKYLATKYSTSEENIKRRISEIKDMENINKEDLEKPKIKIKNTSISNLIDSHIKKENKDELDRLVILEKWLDENWILPYDKMIECINVMFNKEDKEYLLKAYTMQRREILDILKKYNANNQATFEYVIALLQKKYNVSREAIMKRIEEITVVNYIMTKDTNKEEKVKKLKK